MNERRLNFYKSTLHPMLAVFIPYLFFFTFHYAFRAAMVTWIIPSIPDDVIMVINPPEVPPGFFIILLAVGIIQAVITNFMTKERVNALIPRIRELLLFLLGSTIFIVLLRGDYSLKGLNPFKVAVLYPVAMVLLQWILSFVIHRGLKEREVFLSLLLGKDGSELKNMMRDFSAEAGESEKAIARVKRMLLFFQVIVIVNLFLLLALGTGVRPIFVVLSFVYVGMGVSFVIILNHFLEEQEFFGDGLQISDKLQTRKIVASFLVLALAVVLVLIVVGNESLLPASYIGNFLGGLDEWFASMASDETPRYKPQPPGENPILSGIQQARGRLNQELKASEERSKVLAEILKIVALVAVGFIGIGIIVFIIRPLFSKENRERWKESHPLLFLKGKLIQILRFLSKTYQAFVKWLKSPKKGMRRFTRGIVARLRESTVFSREARLARRRELERSALRRHGREIKAFVRVIRWGESYGVQFRKSLGPVAYASMVGKAVPESSKPLGTVADIFEEIVYSGHAIPESRTAEYFQMVKDVVQLKAGASGTSST